MTSLIEELVDGGCQQQRTWRPPVNQTTCVRSNHRDTVAAHPGFSFCRDCLAWLRCETDDDPLDDGAQVAATMRETPPEMWVGYVQAMTGGGSE